MKADFNIRAATWDNNPQRIALSGAIVDAILEKIPLTKETELLDYGAGTGLVSLGLQPYVKSVIAADSAEEMLNKLNEKVLTGGIPNVKTILIDLEKDVIPELRFDVIVTSMVLHHVENVTGMISNLTKMLRPGGYLAIVDLDSDDGEFHHDPTGVIHNGFERMYMEKLFADNHLTQVKTATAFKMTRDVKEKGMREFSIFLISGKNANHDK
jgi:tRNA (cmo5U34)-methyltransferase